jgi:hypothetical protein
MRKPVFRTDDEWRTIVIAELRGLRVALFELALLIAVIAVGASAARWWEYAPIVGGGYRTNQRNLLLSSCAEGAGPVS